MHWPRLYRKSLITLIILPNIPLLHWLFQELHKVQIHVVTVTLPAGVERERGDCVVVSPNCHLDWCSNLISTSVIKYHYQKQLSKERFISAYTSGSQTNMEGSQDRRFRKKLWRGIVLRLLSLAQAQLTFLHSSGLPHQQDSSSQT